MTVDRRMLLGGALSLAAAGVTTPAIAAEPKAKLLRLARRLLDENVGRIRDADAVALIDFSAPSWKPRFHLADLVGGDVFSFLTAHGRGSDPSHTGWLKAFSNEPGSNATSKGAYLTGALYEGKYGRSMRLAGLDPQNSNAEARAIVIHPAWYVGDDMLKKYGKLGRSEGCFALSSEGLIEVLARLGPGRLLYADKLGPLLG